MTPTTEMPPLQKLAQLIKAHNAIDNLIAAHVGRPAERGHVGEYIAAEVFKIALYPSQVHKGSDGIFAEGPLATRTVNVKWYGTQQGLLDLHLEGTPDYYLVLTGPVKSPGKAWGQTNPWLIAHVYLFAGEDVHASVLASGVKMGVATSVRKSFWQAAELYPTQQNTALILTEQQRAELALFAP